MRGRLTTSAHWACPLPPDCSSFVPLALFGNAIGSVLRYPDIGSAVLFPPYAALTAALLVAPRRHWFWYILAGSIAHLTTHWPHWTLSWVLFADAANIARALTAAATLRWLFGGPPRLDSLGALAIFVMSAALLAPAVGATIGAANVVFHGASETLLASMECLVCVERVDRSGDAARAGCGVRIGCLKDDVSRSSAGESARRCCCLAALGATCAAAFLFGGPDGRDLVLMLYAPLPVLMWAALRFGPAGASLALTAVALLAIWSVDRGTAPFLALSTDDNIITLQVFVLLTTVPCLPGRGRHPRPKARWQLYRALLAVAAGSRGDPRCTRGRARGQRLVAAVRRCHGPSSFSSGAPRVPITSPPAAGPRSRGDTIATRILDGVSGVLNRAPRRFQIEYDDDRDGRLGLVRPVCRSPRAIRRRRRRDSRQRHRTPAAQSRSKSSGASCRTCARVGRPGPAVRRAGARAGPAADVDPQQRSRRHANSCAAGLPSLKS